MALTFLDLQNQTLGAVTDFDTTVYGALAKQWLNDGLHDVVRRVNIPALQATESVAVVAGTAGYALPSIVLRVFWMFDPATGQEIQQIDQRAVDTARPSAGGPRVFTLYDNQITLYPTPIAAGTLSYRAQLDTASMVADADLPAPLPDSYAYMLVCFARERLFRHEDDFQAATTWQAEYERMLGKLRSDIQRQSPYKNRQIPGGRKRESRLL